jgi:hypothetical protein
MVIAVQPPRGQLVLPSVVAGPRITLALLSPVEATTLQGGKPPQKGSLYDPVP